MIRSILFKGTLRGNGVVNFDSPDQRFILKKRFPEERQYFDFKNVRIAKHVFYEEKNAQGESVWRRNLCISADCLRQAIFGEDFPFQNTTVMQHPDLLLGVLASANKSSARLWAVNSVPQSPPSSGTSCRVPSSARRKRAFC